MEIRLYVDCNLNFANSNFWVKSFFKAWASQNFIHGHSEERIYYIKILKDPYNPSLKCESKTSINCIFLYSSSLNNSKSQAAQVLNTILHFRYRGKLVN